MSERTSLVWGAVEMLNGAAWGWKEVQAREAAMDEERSAVKTLKENQQTHNRFEFARWLYETGRIAEWPVGYPQEAHLE